MLGTLCGGTHPRLKLRWPQLVRDLPTPSVGRERAGRYVCKPMVFCKSNGEGINSVKVCECGVVGLNLGRLRLESSVDQQPRPGCIPPAERMLENPSAAGIPHPGSLAGSMGPCGPGPFPQARWVRNPPRSKALGSSFRASPAPSRPSSCLAKLCSTTAAAAVRLKIDGGGCLCKISCFPPALG